MFLQIYLVGFFTSLAIFLTTYIRKEKLYLNYISKKYNIIDTNFFKYKITYYIIGTLFSILLSFFWLGFLELVLSFYKKDNK